MGTLKRKENSIVITISMQCFYVKNRSSHLTGQDRRIGGQEDWMIG